MTYIELINDFWETYEDEIFKPADALLYLYLLKVCNRKRWQNPFTLSNKKLRVYLEMTDKAISESRDRLVERGLIAVTKGERNNVPPTYTLLRLCSPADSRTGSKTDSKIEPKTETKTESESKSESKIELKPEIKTESESKPESKPESKTGNIIKDIDKDKDLDIDNTKNKNKQKVFAVVDGMSGEEFLEDFFSDERQGVVEQLCAARGFGSVENLRRVAGAVVAEWEALAGPPHDDLRGARRHLVNHCARKMAAEARAQQSDTISLNPNHTNNYTSYDTRYIDPAAEAKRQRQEDFAKYIYDKINSPDEPEIDYGFG